MVILRKLYGHFEWQISTELCTSNDLNVLPELDAVVIDHDLDLGPSETNETDLQHDLWADELEATVMGQREYMFDGFYTPDFDVSLIGRFLSHS